MVRLVREDLNTKRVGAWVVAPTLAGAEGILIGTDRLSKVAARPFEAFLFETLLPGDVLSAIHMLE